MGAGVDDWDLVNLLFPNSRCDSEIVWLVSSYVQYVWETVHVENSEVKFDRFFGYLTFKYKMHQATSCEQLTKGGRNCMISNAAQLQYTVWIIFLLATQMSVLLCQPMGKQTEAVLSAVLR